MNLELYFDNFRMKQRCWPILDKEHRTSIKLLLEILREKGSDPQTVSEIFNIALSLTFKTKPPVPQSKG